MIIFTENTLGISMTYDGKNGYKGYNSVEGFTHIIYGTKILNSQELNQDSVSTGNIPVVNVYGRTPTEIRLEASLNKRWPSEIIDLLTSMNSIRIKATVKNIFLVTSILTVVEAKVYPREFPIGSRWYVQKYVWKRDTTCSNNPRISLVLLRWYEDE
jgi:hypothetical protein